MKLPIQLSIQDASSKIFQFDKLEEFIEFIKAEQSFWIEKAITSQGKRFTNQIMNLFFKQYWTQ